MVIDRNLAELKLWLSLVKVGPNQFVSRKELLNKLTSNNIAKCPLMFGMSTSPKHSNERVGSTTISNHMVQGHYPVPLECSK